MDFSRTETWIFDLDNTLYPPEAALFAQIEARMTAHVSRVLGVAAAEADRLRMQYWRDYGTTLAGLMAEHSLDPHEYLLDVHDIDFSVLDPDPELAAAISALPGRKIVHTNADRAYAERVLAELGLPVFEAIYGIEEVDFQPKPDPRAYDAVIAAHGFDPARAAMFEDDPRNLAVPATLGMRTILVGAGRHGPDLLDARQKLGDHVQFRTDDLTGFLRSLV
ncbi:putative hydrolase of the HAD superfamily [Paracoccus isoporae]|uniref:Putative hydrolase of the HAD superfamily n=1 Tax=Paracoccus isoporae TaxID=591205 RepID=A0A1G7ECR3_9RHOB|nr:pyrimidine 5'-nucleotidase [Paracoccus isoporae]SDE61494.1 putative hydrolase of the HAD superfamily [Paracoccus isoporae]